MKLLNRSAMVVLPKQPFADWTLGLTFEDALNQALPLAELRKEGTVYLVDEVEEEADFDRLLENNWLAIFQNELAAWDPYADQWPDSMTFDLFNAWFDVYPQILAIDLSKQPLLLAPLED